MTKEELSDIKPIYKHIMRQINDFAYEMRDDRNDGWIQEHYRTALKELRDHINKVLEQ
jgi:hypothetical protein